MKCGCPIWTDGELHGQRYRRALKTRDLQRAIRKVTLLESPDATRPKPVAEAQAAFLAHCAHLEPSTLRKYTNVLDHLREHAIQSGIEFTAEFTVEYLDAYRASRKLARTTSSKELQTLRQFFGFCVERKWIVENVAKKIPAPSNIKPAPVEPYTPQEIGRIISACGEDWEGQLRATPGACHGFAVAVHRSQDF